MGVLPVPAADAVYTMSGPNGPIVRKKAADIVEGEFVWCFVAETYAPLIVGRFQFLCVTRTPTNHRHRTVNCHWFNGDGPEICVPSEWRLFTNGEICPIQSLSRTNAYAFPGFVHNPVPEPPDFPLFQECSNGFLTEELAYFLGAFTIRPQTYVYEGDTWAIFGVRHNASGSYGTASPRMRPLLRTWHSAHFSALQRLATRVWGADNFVASEWCDDLGIPKSVPSGHQEDLLWSARGTRGGFAIHAPILRDQGLAASYKSEDAGLRLLQYWYSFLLTTLRHVGSVSVRKAFVLGAADTASNADRDRRSAGVDFVEGWSSVCPMYAALYYTAETLLDTTAGDPYSNPRVARGRSRGPIIRPRLWELVQSIGFISPMRFHRALQYDPELRTAPLPTFPNLNALTVVLGEGVQAVCLPNGAATNEDDLSLFRLFRADDNARQADYIHLTVAEEGAHCVCSLPLGALSRPTAATSTRPASTIGLVFDTWREDALDKISHISDWLPACTPPVDNDRIFECLVAALVSRMPGCIEAWVVPRSEDQGVDVGARFEMGQQLGAITAVFQAKMQQGAVSRRYVDMLRGALWSPDREKGMVGYLVTTSSFTRPAIRSAERDQPEVRLINGHALATMMLERKVGMIQTGTGRRTRVLLDLSFFSRLRDIVAASMGSTGKIRISLDEYGMPVRGV